MSSVVFCDSQLLEIRHFINGLFLDHTVYRSLWQVCFMLQCSLLPLFSLPPCRRLFASFRFSTDHFGKHFVNRQIVCNGCSYSCIMYLLLLYLRLVVLGFNATLTAKVISWRSVTHMCFLAFSHQY